MSGPDANRSEPERPHADLRCHCGSLMARVTTRGIELKCRRCKRLVLVASGGTRHGWVAVSLHAEDVVSG